MIPLLLFGLCLALGHPAAWIAALGAAGALSLLPVFGMATTPTPLVPSTSPDISTLLGQAINLPPAPFLAEHWRRLSGMSLFDRSSFDPGVGSREESKEGGGIDPREIILDPGDAVGRVAVRDHKLDIVLSHGARKAGLWIRDVSSRAGTSDSSGAAQN